jgi:ProP effector
MDGNVSAEMNTTKKVRDTTVAAVIALLAELYPKCFSVYEGRRRPLKLKIHLDIQAALDGAVTPAELSRALGAYCANSAYLHSSREGAPRIDLDGNPAGVVTAEEAQGAKARLAARKAPKPTTTEPSAPRRLSLADLKAAALARRQSENCTPTNVSEGQA